jgi:pimeloyl-ACP methyl ester carboxylesterase
MEEKKILINGLPINYKISGEGQPVLILHGWGGSSDSWLSVQEILAKNNYKVIVPDFPGFGKSITPPSAWGIKDYTDFIIAFMDKMKLDNFFLIGHSFGGRISTRLAANYDKNIKGLILCDAAGIKPKMGPKAMVIFSLARIGNAIFTPRHFARLKDAARNIFYIFLRNKDYVKAKGTMRETIKKVLNEDLSQELPAIKDKTLIIWGQEDKMVPIKYAHIFKDKIPDSELEIIKGVGHSPHIEVPQKLSQIILNFLNKNS